MFRNEDNKPKINKFLTPMIAGGVFLVFVIVSLLLSGQDMKKFLIILLLLTIIGLCAYFIYSIRKSEKEPVEDQDDSTLLSRLPLRTDLFKRKEEPVSEEPQDLYSYRAEVGVSDNLFGLDDEPMVFDTNRARRTEDASIIRREDPTERDFEDYQLDIQDDEPVLETVPETVPVVEEEPQAENTYRYERKFIERPAFRGFTRSINHEESVASEVEEVKQHRTTFEPARETDTMFNGNFGRFVDETPVEEPVAPARETTFSTNKPFKIPSLDEEPQVETEVVEESTNNNARDNFKIPEVGGSDNTYRSSYNKDTLFQGTGGNTPSRTSKPKETGLFGGAGYKSPFDK